MPFSLVVSFIWRHFGKRISFPCGSISEIVVDGFCCLFVFYIVDFKKPPVSICKIMYFSRILGCFVSVLKHERFLGPGILILSLTQFGEDFLSPKADSKDGVCVQGKVLLQVCMPLLRPRCSNQLEKKEAGRWREAYQGPLGSGVWENY